jgi:hypothetical protein
MVKALSQTDVTGAALNVGDFVTVEYTVVAVGAGGGNNVVLVPTTPPPNGELVPVALNSKQTVFVSVASSR